MRVTSDEINPLAATTSMLSGSTLAGAFIPAAGFARQYGEGGAKISYRENNLALFAGAGIHGAGRFQPARLLAAG